MPATYFSLLTNAGLAKVANANALEIPVSLTQMAVGDGNGNPTTPNVSQTALVRERYRGPINELNVDPENPNYYYAEMVIPADEGGWTVHEAALFANDGSMFAVSNFPATYKPALVEGSSSELVVRMYFEVSNSAAITLLIDPSVVLASRQWVISNFSIAAQIPGGLTGEILAKNSNADGDFEWIDPAAGFAVFVEVIEEHQTLSTGQTIVDLATVTTDGLAVYIDGLRTFDWTATTATQITLGSSYPDDTPIDFVQNDPTAETQDIDARVNQTITDSGQTLNLADPTQLTTAVRTLINSLRTLPKGYISGPPPKWKNANTVTIQAGSAFRDATDTKDIIFTADRDVALNTAAGANSIDAGTEQINTWYYLWAIADSTNANNPAGLFSTSRTSPTMPSGYDKKVLLPGAWRNDASGNLIAVDIDNWPAMPEFRYRVAMPASSAGVTNLVNNLGPASYTALPCGSFIPPNSRVGLFFIINKLDNTFVYLRETGSSLDPYTWLGEGDDHAVDNVRIPVNASQSLDYKKVNGGNCYISVRGFIADPV